MIAIVDNEGNEEGELLKSVHQFVHPLIDSRDPFAQAR